MLRAGASKADQCVLARVIASRDRNLPDRRDHVRIRNRGESSRWLLAVVALTGIAGNRCEQFVQTRIDSVAIEWERKVTRQYLTQVKIDVGNGQWSASPIARGTGIGSGTARPDDRLLTVKPANRSAARGDRDRK